jgi:hypothetical protein
VSRDRLRQGTLWALGIRDIDRAPSGPPLWYSAMEAHLNLGVSVVGDMTLHARISEADVASRLAPLADLFNVHCAAANARIRFLDRARRDVIHAHRVDYLAAMADTWDQETASPLDLGCPNLVVDTTNGYVPSVDDVVEAIVAFASSRPSV